MNERCTNRTADRAGLLGDTAARDYSTKLAAFNAFADRELRAAIASLGLRPGMRVLDAGCGTGEALRWLAEAVAGRPNCPADDERCRDAVGGLRGAPFAHGQVVGVDLASAHAARARAGSPAAVAVLQADVTRPPLLAASFDLVWSVNTINHLHDPRAGLRTLAQLVRSGGRVALGQSSLLPDMYFAWDARLERVVIEAVRRYYRDRYGLEERDLAGVRSLIALLRDAGLREVTARTSVIERTQPLASADEAYLVQVLFGRVWVDRLRPYLEESDSAELERLCDPQSSAFALRRPDFHFLQTFTLAVGEVGSR